MWLAQPGNDPDARTTQALGSIFDFSERRRWALLGSLGGLLGLFRALSGLFGLLGALPGSLGEFKNHC